MIDFEYVSNPRFIFGPGRMAGLPERIQDYGKKVIFITGARSFVASDAWKNLCIALDRQKILYTQASIETEPSPAMVDGIVGQCRELDVNLVVAIGGGSVLDAGKAVSAMILKKGPVLDYLEGVGNKHHDGLKIPFIAVPTTAGTGSEATKNAVISQVGKNGFKKSLRHDAFVPDVALVDPELTINTPADVTAACGMDAVTQLIESFVSTQANAMTDSLAVGALTVLEDALIHACGKEPGDIDLRTRISYAAYTSGLTLANAGLGLVHGFASVIGGKFNIPHGVVCGTLVAEVCRVNIETLIKTDPDGIALKKYNETANLLDPSHHYCGQEEGSRRLISILDAWTARLDIPTLGTFGVSVKDIDRIVRETGQKNNPVTLSDQQLAGIIRTRL